MSPQRIPTRILVLGGAGMLGHKMLQVLRKRFPDTSCTIRCALDDGCLGKADLFRGVEVIKNVSVEDPGTLQKILSDLQPQVIVNCIGIVKQRPEARAARASITINALLPHLLAEWSAEWGGRLIHFSTDCVFSGKRGCYREDDPSDAEDLYGKTKFLGEVSRENAVTFRTSFIGRELMHYRSLLEWFLSNNHSTVVGFKRAFFSGVTTNHLAEVVGNVIECYPEISGVYQIAGRTICKHDLLCLIRDSFGLDIEVVPDENLFCDRSMSGEKFHLATGYVCPSWPELIEQLVVDPTPYENARSRQ